MDSLRRAPSRRSSLNITVNGVGDEDDSTKRLGEKLELKRALREEGNRREKAESEKKDLEKKNKELSEKVKDLKGKVKDLEEKVRDGSKREDRLDMDKKELERKIELERIKIEELEISNQSLEKQSKQLKKNIDRLEIERKDLEKKIKESSSAMTEELARLETENKELGKLTRETSRKIETLETNNQMLSKTLRQASSSSITLSGPEVELLETQEKVSSLETEKREVEKKLRDLQKKLEEVENEKENLTKELKQVTTRLTEKNTKLKEKLEAANSQLKQKDKEIEELKKAVYEAKPKNDKKLLALHERVIHSTAERKSSTSVEVQKDTKDNKLNETLLKEPGAERARIWEYHPNSDQWDDGKWSSNYVVIKMEKRPFAEGSLRNAFQFRNLAQPDVSYVAKFSKNPKHTREVYENDVEMQVFCQKWAEKFNTYDPPKKVKYAEAYLIELIDRRGSPVATMEPFMEGEYRKYSNNDGVVTQYNRNTPQAFSHFTYEKSDHELVIVDIQGVNDWYTDPQIHSVSHQGFGLGNLGQQGIVKFLLTHECNAVCNLLGLPPVQNKHTVSSTITTSNNNEALVPRLTKGTMPFPGDSISKVDFGESPPLLQSESPVDFASFKCIQSIKCDSINSFCLSKDYLFVGTEPTIKVFDLQTFECKMTFTGHVGAVEALCVNSQYLFSGSSDKDIRVWNLDGNNNGTVGKCIQVLDDHTAAIKSLVVDPKRLYSAANDKTIRIWSLEDYTCQHILKGHDKYVKALAISSDFKLLFSGGNDNLIKVWDLDTLTCIYNLDSHTKWVKCLVVSGQYLFSGANDKRLKIWDLSKLDMVKSAKHHTNKINSACINSMFLASSSDDATVKVYDFKSLEPAATLSEHKGAVVSIVANDQNMFTGSFDGLKIWSWGKKDIEISEPQ